MQLQRPGSEASFVIRPSVTLAIPYLGVLGIWFLWLVLTVRFPEDGGDAQLVTRAQLSGVTVGNLLLLVWLAADGFRCRRSPPGLRRGHLVGIALAIAALLVVQVGVLYAAGAIRSS